MVDRTTINIAKKLREELKAMRKFKRETYEEIIERKLKKDLFSVRQKLKQKNKR